MSASTFAIAYRAYLERQDRSECAPTEPSPEQHGFAPIVDAFGTRIENPSVEPLRKAVWQDWERDVMIKTKGRGK